MNNYELYHYGILGQKWGVRRFQNPDGTLTDAGRKRYGDYKSEKTYNNDKKKLRDLTKVASAYSAKSVGTRAKLEKALNNPYANKETLQRYKKNADNWSKASKESINALEKHHSYMEKVYIGKKIKDIKYQDFANGEKFVIDNFLTTDMAVAGLIAGPFAVLGVGVVDSLGKNQLIKDKNFS